ncbi:MAG: TonB-dependent receptor [Pseudomonadota bacterium]
MKTALCFTRTTTAAAASLFCSFVALHGQAAQAQAQGAESQGIDKVIVTAQKREQAAIDVPASVTSLNTEQLARNGQVRLEDYVAQVPGLSISSSRPGFTQVSLRGITTGVAQSAASTAIYIDEAPIGSVNAYASGSSITPDLDPADLQRIEVLKGPQGTLYGAGALGGLMRYVTAPADFQKFKGSVTMGASRVAEGADGSVGRFSLNVPFSDHTMALRLSGFSRKDPGFIDNVSGGNDVNGSKIEGGRVAFSWIVNNGWKVNAFALTQRVNSDGAPVEDVDATTLKPLYGDLQQKRYAPEKGHAQLDVYNVTIHGEVGPFELVSSTTQQEVASSQDGDGTPGYGVALGPLFKITGLGIVSHKVTNTRRLSQEVRLRASALNDKLDYEAGLYYTKEDSSNVIPSFDPFSTTTGAAYTTLPSIIKAAILTRYKEYSLFGNASYAFTPQFDVLAGLRYAKDDQSYSQDYSGLLVGAKPVLIDSGSKNDKATYLVTARYKPTRTDVVYARAATGYRPGGPNAVPPAAAASAPQSFQPDTLTSYELGYKAVLDGGKLSIEAAVFSTQWKDIQIQTSANGFNFFVNGGAATSRGAEASIMYFPMAGLSLRAATGYTQARLSEAAPAAGGLDGDALPFVPKMTASLGATYRWPVMAGWFGYAGSTVGYTGERRSDFSAKSPKDVPAYTTVNLSAGIEDASWRLALYVKNLADTRGITYLKSRSLTAAGNPFAAGMIAPRTVGMDLNYRF